MPLDVKSQDDDATQAITPLTDVDPEKRDVTLRGQFMSFLSQLVRYDLVIEQKLQSMVDKISDRVLAAELNDILFKISDLYKKINELEKSVKEISKRWFSDIKNPMESGKLSATRDQIRKFEDDHLVPLSGSISDLNDEIISSVELLGRGLSITLIERMVKLRKALASMKIHKDYPEEKGSLPVARPIDPSFPAFGFSNWYKIVKSKNI